MYPRVDSATRLYLLRWIFKHTAYVNIPPYIAAYHASILHFTVTPDGSTHLYKSAFIPLPTCCRSNSAQLPYCNPECPSDIYITLYIYNSHGLLFGPRCRLPAILQLSWISSTCLLTLRSILGVQSSPKTSTRQRTTNTFALSCNVFNF